jgi:hypothetical protein
MNSRIGKFLRFGVGIAMCLPALAGSVVVPTVAPEPATIALIGTGIAAVAGVRYYRSRKR